jgi:hypothetical protein
VLGPTKSAGTLCALALCRCAVHMRCAQNGFATTEQLTHSVVSHLPRRKFAHLLQQ